MNVVQWEMKAPSHVSKTLAHIDVLEKEQITTYLPLSFFFIEVSKQPLGEME